MLVNRSEEVLLPINLRSVERKTDINVHISISQTTSKI